MISGRLQGKPFNIIVMQVYAQFYGDPQDLLEHPKKISFSL